MIMFIEDVNGNDSDLLRFLKKKLLTRPKCLSRKNEISKIQVFFYIYEF